MSNVSYARPRLITAEDKRYRAYVAQFLLQRQNQRAMRPPRQRDIFGGQAEEALRGWLSERLPLAETRILEYEERRGRRASTRYRELDALVIEDRRSVWVAEIKASRTAGSVRRALNQLRETRAILRLLFPHVAASILLVDTGIPTAEEISALLAGPQRPERLPETLAEALADMPQVGQIASLDERSGSDTTIDLLCLRVDDIIALVGAENLALNWEADEEEEEPLPAPASTAAYSTTDEDEASDDTDSAFAAALRRAGLSRE